MVLSFEILTFSTRFLRRSLFIYTKNPLQINTEGLIIYKID